MKQRPWKEQPWLSPGAGPRPPGEVGGEMGMGARANRVGRDGRETDQLEGDRTRETIRPGLPDGPNLCSRPWLPSGQLYLPSQRLVWTTNYMVTPGLLQKESIVP